MESPSRAHLLVVAAFIVMLAIPAATAAAPGAGTVRERAAVAAPAHAQQHRSGKKKRKKTFPRFFNFQTTGDGCGSGSIDVPNMRPWGGIGPDAETWIGDTDFVWCFYGFDVNKPIAVHFAWPDGRVTDYTAPPYDPPLAKQTGSESLALSWQPLPGMPLGAYAVTAEQGSRRAEGSVTVTLPKFPVLSVPDRSPRVGEPFRLLLGGFPANRRVRVAIYRARATNGRCPGQPKRHREPALCLTKASFLVRVDSQGQAIKTITARKPTYRSGAYILAASVAGKFVARTREFFIDRAHR